MSLTHRPRRALLGALVLGSLAALAVPGAALAAPGPASGAGVQPVEFPGNLESKDCPTGTFGYTVQGEDLADNPHTFGGFSVTTTTTATASGDVLAFTANMGVDQVFVKGGTPTNVYTYAPERSSDTLLHAPINPNNDKYFGISHVTFCVDFELQVSKTAATTFDRDYDWTIDKSNDAGTAPIAIAPGQSYIVNYAVRLAAGAPTDSNFAVSGDITVTNPAPVAATGVAVTDVISRAGDPDIAGAVVCPATTIAAGGTMTCTYSAALPDGNARTNTATATTTTAGIGSGSGTAAVTFGAPTDVYDECVDVTDDKTTGTPAPLGTVCVADSPKTFTYAKTFGPFPNECKTHTFTNVAAFTTNDTGQTGSDTSTVVFDVKCVVKGGCTLTQGYWKTHSEHGPAPYDDTWGQLPDGADTEFFDTNTSWYDLFWTAPKGGNAFIQLAHQWMAARLNQRNGASTPLAVQIALAQAVTYFEKYDNAGTVPAANAISKADREQMVKLAGIIAAYNEGTTGPGHCDDDHCYLK